MLDRLRADVYRDRLCSGWYNRALQALRDNRAECAHFLGAVYAVGHSSKRAGRLANSALEIVAGWEDGTERKWDFAAGMKWGLDQAIPAFRKMGYTDKDFDRWGWLPDDVELRAARLAELMDESS